MREELRNPRLFVPLWFNKLKKFKMKPNGYFEGDHPAIFATLYLDYCEIYTAEYTLAEPTFDVKTGKKVKVPKISEKNLEKAWNEFLKEEQDRARSGALDTLNYKAEDDTELASWLNAVTGQATELQICVLKHVLWLVKRKIKRKPVKYHLCPVFFGKQSGGKSTAVYKLFQPLEDFRIEFSPAQVIDERNARSLSENYVCIFDEMAGSTKVEMEALKRIITADYSTFRPLHTNRHMKVAQNCTFIGISNKSLSENIYDPTGLRRFFEFTCLDVLNWELLAKVDVNKIWHSINESLDEGYILPVLDQLKEHQEELTVGDEIQDFIKETSLKPATDGEVKEITANELWRAYDEWRMTAGYGSRPGLVVNSLCMKLRSHKFKKKVKRVNGKEKTVYTVNAKSTIFGPVLTLVENK